MVTGSGRLPLSKERAIEIVERVFAPKGLHDSARGFNPGNRPQPRSALKGRRRWRSIPLNMVLQNRDESLVDVRAETDAWVHCFLNVVRPVDVAPLQCASLGGDGPGVETPGLEFGHFRI